MSDSERIIELDATPTISDSDYVVIDGQDGTRKTPVSNLFSLHGDDVPSPDQGIPGMIYVRTSSGTVVKNIYHKKNDTDWKIIK